MTNIKICGIRTINDINILNRFKPEFAGFVFASGKRRVDIREVITMSGHLDVNIKKVGVFVNAPVEEVVDTALQCGLHAVQLHGEEDNSYCTQIYRSMKLHGQAGEFEIWKAVRVKGIESIACLDDYNVDAFVLDAWCREAYGGTGKTFDWEIIAGRSMNKSASSMNKSACSKIILAGGLNPGNVSDAVKLVKPFAVDVSSGVELGGGKDEELVKRFVHVVRNNTDI